MRRYRPPHAEQKAPRQDDRPSAHQRGYTARWQVARKAYLRDHPLCVRCEKAGLLVPATCVDHIIPHRGDELLFWASETNWQSLCNRCHCQKTGKGE